VVSLLLANIPINKTAMTSKIITPTANIYYNGISPLYYELNYLKIF